MADKDFKPTKKYKFLRYVDPHWFLLSSTSTLYKIKSFPFLRIALYNAYKIRFGAL